MADEASVSAAPAEVSAPDVSTSTPDVGQQSTEQEAPKSTPEERYRIKVAGQERDLSRAEIEKYAGMGLSANEKWEEAAKFRKQSEAWTKQLKENPSEFLANPDLGLDMDSISMEYLSRKVDAQLAAEAEARMTPQERQAKIDAKELQEYRDRNKQTTEQQSKEAQAKADKEWADSTRQSMVDGLKNAKLPYTNFTHNSVLQHMATAMDAGHHDVTVEDVLPFVAREYHASFDGLFEGEEEEMLSRFSPDKIQKLQDAIIKRAKGGNHTPKEAAPPPEPEISYQDQIEEVKRKIRLGEI